MSHQKPHRIGTAVAILALGLAAGGGGPDPETIQDNWVLEAVILDGEPYELPFEYAGSDGVLTSARFDENGVLWLEGPCNDGRGDYEFDGRELILTGMMHSAVYCVYPGGSVDPPESTLMDAEEVVFVVLRNGVLNVTFSGVDSESMQMTANGTVLTFHRESED